MEKRKPNQRIDIIRIFHPGGNIRGAQDGAVPHEPQDEQDGHRRARPLRAEGQPLQRASHTHAAPLDSGKWLKLCLVDSRLRDHTVFTQPIGPITARID